MQYGKASLAYLLREAGAQPEAATVLLAGAKPGRLGPDSPNLLYCQVYHRQCLAPEYGCFQNERPLLPRRNGFRRALIPGLVCYGFGEVAAADCCS